MTEFDDLKSSYVSAIQCGLAMGAGYNRVKQLNDILHTHFEILIDNSNYDDLCKMHMKNELEVIKEALVKEIESFYNK